MTKILKSRLLILLPIFIFSITTYGQKDNKVKILGTWNFVRAEMLQPVDDTASIINNMKGMVITFKEGNKFITHQQKNGKTKLVESGSYSFSEDGSYIIQNDVKARIVTLDDITFSMEVEETLIMYFKRVEKPLLTGSD
ncbi:MAG: hypothetical protein QM791_23570 [Ferruginibacter sp.]